MNPSSWKRWILWAAGAYNLTWGALAILFPLAFFRLAGLPDPDYPELWQCIGMIVGVYGVGYLIASTSPTRHWPIVLVGLLGKVLGPLGFAKALVEGRLPAAVGWTILTNDLIWWIPFALILKGALDAHLGQRRVLSGEVARMGLRARTQKGLTLLEMSTRWPTMVVFLRHFGCPFCREALADLASQREAIESNGVRIALVHMSSEEEAAAFFRRHDLQDVARVSDPDQAVYRAFGLDRGRLMRIFGPREFARGFQAAFLDRHGIAIPSSDAFQMPGVFLVFHGEVIRAFRHQSAADRPDYVELSAPVPCPETV